MLLHVLTMNDMRTLDNIVGWPLTETSEGGGSQPIRAQLLWRLTNQRQLPDLGDKEQPHLVTRAPHSSGFRHLEFRSDKEPCSGEERTWHGGMSYDAQCEGSLHSWSDLSWPVAGDSNPISPQASLHCCDSDDAVSHQPHMDQGWNYGVRNLFITIALYPCLYWC